MSVPRVAHFYYFDLGLHHENLNFECAQARFLFLQLTQLCEDENTSMKSKGRKHPNKIQYTYYRVQFGRRAWFVAGFPFTTKLREGGG